MAFVRIQGDRERDKGIYYEYDPADTPLGEGGMGKVYKGWLCSETTHMRREVAIKFLYSDLPAPVIARARREAAVQLRNDNLIEMLGFVETVEKDVLGQPVRRFHVISEYLHGVPLDRLLEGDICDPKGNVIPFARELYGKYLNDPYNFALTVVRSILAGLSALHDAGYIHRDIDPSNIMVTSNTGIKLIDFGIAKKINGYNTRETSYTIDGQIIGKPRYAAPELARGLVDSQNATTDLYAVGILLYQLLVGHVPFEGEMAEILEMQINKNVPLQCVRQRAIRRVIRKATQKKRSRRYQSAAEFRVAVDRLVPLPYPSPAPAFLRWGLAGAGTAAAVVIAFAAFRGFRPAPVPAPLPPEPIHTSASHSISAPSHEAAPTYADAVALLSAKATADSGLAVLRSLAPTDARSAFLLSRLYLDSPDNIKVGTFSDSVVRFRGNLDITPQNTEAHRLLKNAVALAPHDYRALFELGCDYKSGRRGVAANDDSAYFYLSRAHMLAAGAGDSEYLKAISGRIENISSIAKTKKARK